MNEKLKNVFLGIWGIIWFASTALGFTDILEFIHIPSIYSAGIGTLFAAGSFVGIVYLNKDEK